MVKFIDGETDSTIVEATRLCATEAVQRLEEDLALSVGDYCQPEAPWS
jgi:hypothetical protein